MSRGFDRMPDAVKLIWMGLKLAVILFAIFQATNVTVLYQGF